MPVNSDGKGAGKKMPVLQVVQAGQGNDGVKATSRKAAD